MKKILSLFLIAAVGVSISSCKKYLDVNTNTNQATTNTPELVLPQAITAVAGQNWAFNFYGAQTVGYVANGGGVGGWGAIITYNYASTDQQALWNNGYDIANDIQYVINNTEGKAGDNANMNAAAKVMKAFVFQRLVDQYNDIPYSQALQGGQNVTPAYDKATAIYKSLADLCDAAITQMKASGASTAVFNTADVLFGGNKTNWMKFAQTLKLRLILRASGKGVTFTNTTFDSTIGFLTDDAIVNPGYAKIDGKQNPTWNSFAFNAAGSVVTAGAQYAPTPFILSFYNGTKLTDPARAAVTYKAAATATPVGNTSAVATNQLGFQGATAGRGATPNSWFIGGTTSTSHTSQGIFKGPDAGQPIMLLAESNFLQAEGALKGTITGDPKTLFDAGIAASFRYMYKNSTNGVVAGKNPSGDAAAYQLANKTNTFKPYLSNYDLATTLEQRLEAIITQKYIAFNMLFGDEAWNEYRRTGYPVSINDTKLNPSADQTIVSTSSEATTNADRLPTRLQYPNSEFQYNAANVPTIDKYTTKIFWAK